jgi:NAD(P)-dependent dehydrogenase (short-subunit alcohol dehydrogenase family)
MQSGFDLHGHTALVTGAGRRLGRAFAEAIAAEGADLVVHYGRSQAGAEEAVRAAQQHGIRAVAIQADLSDPGQAADLILRSLELVPEVDLLVNSAAIFESVGALDAPIESWQRHLDINLTAPFLISQAFARSRNGEPGAIVNLLDWRALVPSVDHFPYSISKAALAALTRGLALALAPSVRVNGLALGAILPAAEGGSEDPIRGVPAGRWGTVGEAVEGLLFLLGGPKSMTGEILQIDGGRHLTG